MDLGIERYHGNSLVLPVALTDSQGVAISLVGALIQFKLGEITELSSGYTITRNDLAGTFVIISFCYTDGHLGESHLLLRM